jgi:hypothetical protein
VSVPSPARTLVLLRRIHDKYGPQGFGRVSQTLLALSFQAQGFRVTKNPVGVPDIMARRQTPAGGFAIEAKTSQEWRVTLPERELKGLTDSGLTPTLAVLSFPDRDPQWFLIDAKDLSTGTYEIARLVRHARINVGFDVNLVFRTVLGERIGMVMENLEALDSLLREGS